MRSWLAGRVSAIRGSLGRVAGPVQTARQRDVALMEIFGVLGVFLVLRRLGLVTPWPVAAYIVLFVGAGGLATAVNNNFAARTTVQMHLRLAVNVGVAAAVMYACGWGPVLVIGFMFIANDAVQQGGSIAAWPAFAWSAGWIAVGQLAIALGVRSMVGAPTVHGLAVLGVTGLALAVNVLANSSRKEESAREHLAYEAHHDTLTGLWNRTAFLERLAAVLCGLAPRHALSVLFIDLDDFKTVNDSLGHFEGDHVLIEATARLRSCLSDDDVLARFGGDEFAVLSVHAHDIEPASIARRVLDALEAPFVLSTEEVVLRASVGIVTRPSAVVGPGAAEQVLRDADAALYCAKGSGKGTHAEFRPAMHRAAVDRLALTADLRRAVERNEFVVHYQPTVGLVTGEVVGLEALVRWAHPQRGLIPPAQFIARAEETGLIVPLGRWVLEQACHQLSAWQRQRLGQKLLMSVNLSARQLSSPALVADVAVVLADTNLEPDQLVLEITESFLLDDVDLSVARLKGLKELGVRLAIDDFGTGYSSLSYLRRFPVDVLKIDKSFVDDIVTEADGAALIEAILHLGRTLNLETVAEGIEDRHQAAVVRQAGCDLGQGFYFARPHPFELLQPMLAAPASPPNDNPRRSDRVPVGAARGAHLATHQDEGTRRSLAVTSVRPAPAGEDMRIAR